MTHLSICIPTYRQVKFLKATLESIRSQNFDNYELIISDDSPNDDVSDLVKTFNFGNKLIYYKNHISLGSPENWNQAIRHARGNYIKILHHDDRLANPDALKSFVKLLDDNPGVDFGFSATCVQDVNSQKINIHTPSQHQIDFIKNIPETLFFGNVIGAPSATIYRRSEINILYDVRLKWLVDIDFYIRMLRNNQNFIHTAEPLIVTPTNAEHQVTEQCKNSAEIELYEYLILFEKISSHIFGLPNTYKTWFWLFQKYNISTIKDLELILRNSEVRLSLLEPYINAYNKQILGRIYSRLGVKISKVFRHVKGRFAGR